MYEAFDMTLSLFDDDHASDPCRHGDAAGDHTASDPKWIVGGVDLTDVAAEHGMAGLSTRIRADRSAEDSAARTPQQLQTIAALLRNADQTREEAYVEEGDIPGDGSGSCVADGVQEVGRQGGVL